MAESISNVPLQRFKRCKQFSDGRQNFLVAKTAEFWGGRFERKEADLSFSTQVYTLYKTKHFTKQFSKSMLEFH